MEAPMLSPDRIAYAGELGEAAADYEVVRRAIGYIRNHWREQPEIEAIADAASVTPTELHHLFRRWAGLSPKAFLQALTLDGARQLLRDSASVLDASYEVGLSGPGRLHDLFVTHEAMSPGEWKSGGEGLTIRFGFHPSPFGKALIMATERGLAGVAFADAGEEEAALTDMRRRWPEAAYVADEARTACRADRHRLGSARLGRAPENPDGPGRDLFGNRRKDLCADGGPCGRRRGGQEPDRLRGAVSPRHREIRQAHRLSLGHHPQARDARLGSRASREGSVVSYGALATPLPSPPGLTRGSLLTHRDDGKADCSIKPRTDTSKRQAAKSFFSATVESALSR